MLDKELESVRQVGQAIVDPYIAVTPELGIVDFNGAFHALFPRPVARRLKKMRCCDALGLDICKDRCIALEAIRRGQNVRYDEIVGTIRATGEEVRLIGSATPLLDEQGRPVGALVIYRNVTDEAKVQAKYKSMLEEAGRERQALMDDLAQRTRDLLGANERLTRLEEALATFRKGLWEPSYRSLQPAAPAIRGAAAKAEEGPAPISIEVVDTDSSPASPQARAVIAAAASTPEQSSQAAPSGTPAPASAVPPPSDDDAPPADA